jgi:predicted ribosomally synthesized peptide with SipW-like signal peptide
MGVSTPSLHEQRAAHFGRAAGTSAQGRLDGVRVSDVSLSPDIYSIPSTPSSEAPSDAPAAGMRLGHSPVDPAATTLSLSAHTQRTSDLDDTSLSLSAADHPSASQSGPVAGRSSMRRPLVGSVLPQTPSISLTADSSLTFTSAVPESRGLGNALPDDPLYDHLLQPSPSLNGSHRLFAAETGPAVFRAAGVRADAHASSDFLTDSVSVSALGDRAADHSSHTSLSEISSQVSSPAAQRAIRPTSPASTMPVSAVLPRCLSSDAALSWQSYGEGADIVEGLSALSSPSHVGDSTAGFFSARVRSAMNLADVSAQSSLSSLPAHTYAYFSDVANVDGSAQLRAHADEADSDAALAAMTLTLSPVQHAAWQRVRGASADSRAAAGGSAMFSTPSLDVPSTPSLSAGGGGSSGGGEQTRMSSEAIERHLLLTSDDFDRSVPRDFCAAYARLSPAKTGAQPGSATPSSWYAWSDASDKRRGAHAADAAVDTPRYSESSEQSRMHAQQEAEVRTRNLVCPVERACCPCSVCPHAPP